MKKKVYITPALTTDFVQMESMMMVVSGPKVVDDDENPAVQNRGMDTKSEGQWDDFWDSLVN
jgi:hypothetical protein